MVMGGELYEIKRRGIQGMKLNDSEDALSMRLKLTKELQHAEKRWRDRLLKVLDKGWVWDENENYKYTYCLVQIVCSEVSEFKKTN